MPSWLESQGISRDLQKRYLKSGWLKSIGTGAYVFLGDDVNWKGALFTLQEYLHLQVHVGALSALSLQGLGHFSRFKNEILYVFSSPKVSLPLWFLEYAWEMRVNHIKTSIFPLETGLGPLESSGLNLIVASPERAIMECLYLAPDEMDLAECYDLLGGLSNLRPKLLQQLLEKCNSIKVKRLFLHLSHKAGHRWVDYLNEAVLDLGTGDRGIVKGGTYVSKYKITVPKELA